MKNKRKRITATLLAAVVAASSLSAGFLSRAADFTGMGETVFAWDREIYSGVQLKHLMTNNDSGMQKIYTTEFNPTTCALKPVLHYGGKVMGGDIMSDMVSQVEASGQKVVFAVNGDAYDTTNGVSNGLMIQNGKLISTSNGSEAVGFREDGSVLFGGASLDITAKAGDTVLPINHVNKERKLDAEQVYLLTEQFDSATRSTQEGVEVVLDVTTPNYSGLEIGGEIAAQVKSVNQVANNPEKNNTAIGKGQVVLSAHKNSSRYAALSGLQPGQPVTISVRNNNADVDWSEATQALGIFHVLVKNGQVTPGAAEDSAVHPRTVFGTKPDGSVVLFQCDGRQSGFADGVTFREIIEYMQEIGCVNVFNFDGGGSSTITATLPGDEESTILNRPSDGQERANCNALLFVATSPAIEGNPVQKLHVYPDIAEGYGNSAMLLENGKLGLQVGATDNNYHYASLANTELTYKTEGGIGSIDENGVLTAAPGAHDGKVVVSTRDGSVSGELKVKTVDTVTRIVADRSILSVAPSKTTQLQFSAEYNGVPVVLSSEALSFKLSDDSLGSISPDGTFTAGDKQGTGELTISYKDYSLIMPVEIGKLPVLLNDFEQPLEEMGWSWMYANPNNGGSGSMSINTDERFVKSGDASLRIDYDFATKPLTGTVAIQAGPEPMMTLEGQPKAIGCWVYGDGNGGWLRIQLAPATFVGDTYVDWVGWKYIETEIPTTAAFPYQLKYGVRLIGTANVANNKKGTLYVDSLRAIYDFKNDDTAAPELVEGSEITPADGAADVDHQPEISMTVHDPAPEGQPYTGINTQRTKLWINGKVMTNVLHETQPDGSVKINYIPSALTRLRSGVNKIKYRVEDNAGNKFFKEWSFTVEGYNVNLQEIKPSGQKAAAGSSFDYIIQPNDYRNFEEFQFEMSYNPLFVTMLSHQTDSRLTVENQQVDEQAGTVKFTLKGMDALPKDDANPLVKFRFQAAQQAGGQTGIRIAKALVRETGEVEGTDLVLEGYDQEIENKYTLSWKGSTVGHDTMLTLTDSSGAPVQGMGFQVTSNGQPVALDGVTDENGQLITQLFGSHPEGTVFQVWTQDADGALSNKAEIPVYASLGEQRPSKIVVTTGEDPATGVGISWETDLSVTKGNLIIGTKEDLSDGTTIPATGRPITTTVNGQDRLYQAWGAYTANLKPSTTYFYRVGQGEQFSDVKSFTTAPDAGDLTIAFYGDIQGGYTNMPSTIGMVKELYPDIDLSLLAGDVADNGHVDSDWTAIDSAMGGELSSGIWAATVGNHDAYYDAQAFSSFFYGPANGTYNTPRNYAFTAGDIKFYNLDTEAAYSYDPDFAAQIAKMKEVFSNTDKTYKAVLMHRSAYPMNYDEEDVRKLHKVFDELQIDVVLSGHDHIYSRTEMAGGEPAQAGSGVQYVVGGSSSGSKFYTADTAGRPWQQVVYDDDNPVFSALKIRGGRLEFEAYANESGSARKIDSFTVSKHKVRFDKTVLSGPSSIKEGASAEYTIRIPEGQKVDKVTVNKKEVAVQNNRFTIENAAADMEIQVTFVPLSSDELAVIAFAAKLDKASDGVDKTNLAEMQTLVDMYDQLSDGAKKLLTAEQAEKIASIRRGILLLTPADYSKVDAAIADLPKDWSIYTEESSARLQAALDAVVRDKNASDQQLVDSYADAIRQAISQLTLKPSSPSEPSSSASSSGSSKPDVSESESAVQPSASATRNSSTSAETGSAPTGDSGRAAPLIALAGTALTIALVIRRRKR